MIGETISHYRILARLGQGGMGEVYKAQDLRLQRLVALKLMLEEAKTDHSKQRFVREARAASALNHPNIATVYEIDEIEREGSLYSFIVMEFVEGRTLKDYADQLAISEVIDIVMQIAEGLAEAHARGIVHRDIKPSNVMLNEGRRVKLLDFGVAKYQPPRNDDAITESLSQSDVLMTTPGLVIGTFAYMSPEQALGKDVDQRGDIFSLGVMFYELLAGRHPFDGRTTLALVDSILHEEPRPLSVFNPKVTPELEAICRRMLAKNREQRYPTAGDVLRDLEKVNRGLTTNEGDPYRTSTALPIRESDSTGGGHFTSGTVTGKSLAVMNFSNITKNDSDDWLGVGIAETVTADLKTIEGISVIGRERVHEVTRRMNITDGADFDNTLATTIGREVNARWIISGGYQRVGEIVRITARFVDVTTGEVVRTVKIDGPMSQIFDLQDKIVYELSQGLDFTLKSGERDKIGKHETSVIEAYETFTRGMIELRALSKDAIDRAIELFRKAIQLDPKYARVYAMLGYTLGMKGSSLSQRHLTEEAVALLQKAIELAPSSAESYSALGLQFISMNRIDEAIGAIRRALSFAPDDSTGRTALGRAYFLGKGMFREAAEQFEQALSSKPFSGWIALQLSQCYAYLGEFKRGEEVAKIAVALEEQMESGQEALQIVGAHTRLGHIYALQDRFEDAIAEYYREIVFLRGLDHVLRERSTLEVHSKLVSAYVRLGEMKDAKASFEILSINFRELIAAGVDEPFTRYYIAAATAMIGKKEEALQLLEKAIEERPAFNIARARVDRDFESLRSDPRFLALIEAKE